MGFLGYKLSIKLMNPLKMLPNDPEMICSMGHLSKAAIVLSTLEWEHWRYKSKSKVSILDDIVKGTRQRSNQVCYRAWKNSNVMPES